MASEEQLRQRKLFIQKGQLVVVNAIANTLATNPEYSTKFRKDLLDVGVLANNLLDRFNQEVGWK